MVEMTQEEEEEEEDEEKIWENAFLQARSLVVGMKAS